MLKILVVEDDLMIADMAEEILVDAGYEVCGIARTVDEGVSLARRHKPILRSSICGLRMGGSELRSQPSWFLSENWASSMPPAIWRRSF
jgi:DNA-binding response OmpR family regulator